MSDLSVFMRKYFEKEVDSITNTVVEYLYNFDLSGSEKKQLAMSVLTTLHIGTTGPLAAAEIDAISYAIEFALGALKRRLARYQTPAPTPVPAPPPVHTSIYNTWEPAPIPDDETLLTRGFVSYDAVYSDQDGSVWKVCPSASVPSGYNGKPAKYVRSIGVPPV